RWRPRAHMGRIHRGGRSTGYDSAANAKVRQLALAGSCAGSARCVSQDSLRASQPPEFSLAPEQDAGLFQIPAPQPFGKPGVDLSNRLLTVGVLLLLQLVDRCCGLELEYFCLLALRNLECTLERQLRLSVFAAMCPQQCAPESMQFRIFPALCVCS